MGYKENLYFGASQEMINIAQELRKHMTLSEKHLWEKLKTKQFLGYKFRRQHPIAKYITDFYCHQVKLVIEVDGGIHGTRDALEYDENRTFELVELGIEVVRFTNEEVLHDLERVLNAIQKKIEFKKNASFERGL